MRKLPGPLLRISAGRCVGTRYLESPLALNASGVTDSNFPHQFAPVQAEEAMQPACRVTRIRRSASGLPTASKRNFLDTSSVDVPYLADQGMGATMDRSSASLMSGVPELMILQLLARNEMYGYELARTIRTLTTDAISVGESVLYPVLHGLEKRGLVRGRRRAVAGRTRVYYSITQKGARRLAALTSHWQRISEGVEAVLQGARHA